MLTQREFELLTFLMEHDEPLSQRRLAGAQGCSVGTVNRLLKELQLRGLCEGQQVTEEGRGALEPYRVRRAIILAAGVGARLLPVTLNTPKALIRVRGRRVIDSLLDAVTAAGIEETVIVRGHLAEQFDQLLYKYPKLRFVENPLFNECNNIASAMQVRDLFQNAYVMDGDLILRNPALIRTFEYRTNLLGVPMDRTDDWCVTTDKNGFVSSMAVGGEQVYREVGISYWTAEDGARLAEDLTGVYCSPGGKKRFWEQTALIDRKEHYHIAVRPCRAEDVAEIDTLHELKMLDPSYGLSERREQL